MSQQLQIPRWDYLVVSCTNQNGQWWIAYVNGQQAPHKTMFEYMQEAGNQGWELVSTQVDPPIARPSEVLRLFFKRRR